MAKKSASRIQLEVKYRELRKKLTAQITKIEKSPYAKDVESAIKYIEPRIPVVSKIKTKRNLEFAIKEAEAALKNKTFVGAERRRLRKEAVSNLNSQFSTDIFKTWRDAKKFYEFMELVRTHSADVIYDSYKAVDIFIDYSSEPSKLILQRYKEYTDVFSKRSRKKTSF